jgi:hypothetical protein
MDVSHLYKVTNKISGEYYIGKHNGWTQKTNKNQLYWGSGIRIMNLVKKYGIDNFTYEIMCYGTPEYIFNLEQKYVSVELVENDNLCLNLTIGGQGVGYHTKESKEKLRLARAKQVMPADMYEKTSKIMSSLIWMNDGKRSYRVRPCNLQDSINKGFVHGRLLDYIDDKYKEKRKMSAIKQWQKVRESQRIENLKGYISCLS